MNTVMRLVMLLCVIGNSFASQESKHSAQSFKKIKKTLSILAKKETNPEISKSIRAAQGVVHTIQKSGAFLTKKQAETSFSILEQSLKMVKDSKDSSKCVKSIECVKKILQDCCKRLNHKIDRLTALVEENFQCAPIKKIDTVPVTISAPGKYCVSKELVYTGADVAIRVISDNVTINFSNFSLTLTNPNAIGLLADGVSEFTLNDDAIVYNGAVPPNQTSAAVSVQNSSKVTLNNVVTRGTFIGAQFRNSSQIELNRTRHSLHRAPPSPTSAADPEPIFSAALRFENCRNMDMNSVVGFENSIGSGTNNHGVIFTNTPGQQTRSFNLTMNNCKFLNTRVMLDNIEGALLTGNFHEITDPDNETEMLQIGQGNIVVPTAVGADIISKTGISVQTSQGTFRNTQAHPGFNAISLRRARGVSLANHMVNINHPSPSRSAIPVTGSAIHVGNASSSGDDSQTVIGCTITNSLITGVDNAGPNMGIHAERNCSGLTLSGLTIQNFGATGVKFDGTVNSALQASNVVRGDGDGVVVTGNAQANTFGQNVIADNGGDGIFFDASTSQNQTHDLQVLKNRRGISDNGANNVHRNGNSCQNTGTNCSGTVLQQSPGAPQLQGANTCCA